MNNYSAESSTEEVMSWLEGVLTSSAQFHLDESVAQQRVFNDAKTYVKDIISDDEHLLTILQDNMEFRYTTSEYEYWLMAGFWENLFESKPHDDRVSHIKDTEHRAVTDARVNIANVFLDMNNLQEYFRTVESDIRDEACLGQFKQRFYLVGYKSLFKMLKSRLPSDTYEQYIKMRKFESDLKAIRRMAESLAVYEFNTVTIEEDMLAKINSVQTKTNSKKL